MSSQLAVQLELDAATEALADVSGSEAVQNQRNDAYADALERWLSLGAADLDERAVQVAADVGLNAELGTAMSTLVERCVSMARPSRFETYESTRQGPDPRSRASRVALTAMTLPARWDVEKLVAAVSLGAMNGFGLTLRNQMAAGGN